MSDMILCGPCGYAEYTQRAEKWCTVCEEGLCEDCEKVHKSIKTSRNHKLISIEDYRQIKDISVNLDCKDHDKSLELYCKTHDSAACLDCVTSHHRACSDVIPLDKAAENAKHSTALADLEDTLNGTLQNLEQMITDRVSVLETLDVQKLAIKSTVNETRARISKKLDDLETKCLLDLDTKYGYCKSDIDQLINRLRNCERDLTFLQEQTIQLKSFASDVQLFQGMRHIHETVLKDVECVKESFKNVQNYEMYFQFNLYRMIWISSEKYPSSILPLLYRSKKQR